MILGFVNLQWSCSNGVVGLELKTSAFLSSIISIIELINLLNVLVECLIAVEEIELAFPISMIGSNHWRVICVDRCWSAAWNIEITEHCCLRICKALDSFRNRLTGLLCITCLNCWNKFCYFELRAWVKEEIIELFCWWYRLSSFRLVEEQRWLLELHMQQQCNIVGLAARDRQDEKLLNQCWYHPLLYHCLLERLHLSLCCVTFTGNCTL